MLSLVSKYVIISTAVLLSPEHGKCITVKSVAQFALSILYYLFFNHIIFISVKLIYYLFIKYTPLFERGTGSANQTGVAMIIDGLYNDYNPSTNDIICTLCKPL